MTCKLNKTNTNYKIGVDVLLCGTHIMFQRKESFGERKSKLSKYNEVNLNHVQNYHKLKFHPVKEI